VICGRSAYEGRWEQQPRTSAGTDTVPPTRRIAPRTGWRMPTQVRMRG